MLLLMQAECGVFVVPDLGEIGVFRGEYYAVARVEPYGLTFNDQGKTVILYDLVNLYENLINFISKELNNCKNITFEIDAKEVKLDSPSSLFMHFDYTTLLYILALRSRPSLIHVVGGRGVQRGVVHGEGKIMARASIIPPRYVSKRPPPFLLPHSIERTDIIAHRISGERYKTEIKIRAKGASIVKIRVLETESLYKNIVGGLVSYAQNLNWVEYVYL
ncbi:hypothetical protein TTX_0756 [Thermoproteus tenax Kra 1]|uniref:Uncharacterized protein n=2 Tax=Thermoproteus tenax TaxID=2271 RepID=G4RPB6_THETK|nr:hypothetical protein TTX_0756 [Thermoproteus tenax Kra 1]